MTGEATQGLGRSTAQPVAGRETTEEQGRRGRITLFWLSVCDLQQCQSVQVEWTDGERLAALPAVVEKRRGCPELIEFPWWLLHDALAFSRWGLRLRWESPIRLGDELAILDAVTADAKRWRLEQAKRQRKSGRQEGPGRQEGRGRKEAPGR
jgi:hypothetical protein